MMKRYMPIALAAILVLALAVPTAAGPFADVPENHWAYEAVKQLAAYGLVEGFPDGTFKGAQPMTRYQMAMVIARLLVSLDAQIKAEIEAAKAGLTPAPVAAPTEKVVEKETVTVEKPVIEKVVEHTIVEKLKTEELDALTARVAAIEGKASNVEGAVDAVSGKVDEVDKKADEANAKLVELDGAIALLEGEFSVKALELESKIAAGDADLADELAAFKAELEQKIAAGDNELSAKIEAKAKELIALIDALKSEFNLELTALGVRVVALEEQLALANAKIADLEQKIVAGGEGLAAVSTKLDEHIAGHEKVAISGSSEVVLTDQDVYAGEGFNEEYAWKDPNDIFQDDPDDNHGMGTWGSSWVPYYTPKSTLEHKLDLTLTANVAEGVVAKATLGTVKKIYGAGDSGDFQLSDLSLEVTTPGMLTRLYAGGVTLPEGTFTPYTLTADELIYTKAAGDPYYNWDVPKYEGAVGQVTYGKFSGTTLFLRLADPVSGAPGPPVINPRYARYAYAGEGRVALTDNLKLGVAYVSVSDDPQSLDVDLGQAFVTPVPEKDTVLSVTGDFSLAPGWKVSGEFAKNTHYEDAAVVTAESGTAMKLDVTGKVGALELTGNITRVENEFGPELVNLDPDGDGVKITNIKSVSVNGTLPIGNLTLEGGYKVTGDADNHSPDWDSKRTNITTAGASYKMTWGALTVTPSVDLDNRLYVLGNTVYGANGNVFKVTGGVKAELAPVTVEYKGTAATKKAGAGAAEPYYTENVFDAALDYKMTPNLTLTGGYNWSRLDDKLDDFALDDTPYGIVDSNTSELKAGLAAEFPVIPGTNVKASYDYAVMTDSTDPANAWKPYSKSIVKTGLNSQLTPKASVDAKAEFYRLDRWLSATEPYEFAPLNNLIAELNYTYNIATNTTLKLGYKVVKSDKTTEPDEEVDYTARIISGSLKVTF